MTPITHATTGVTLAVLTGQPIWLGIGFSLLPDVDHLFRIHTWRFRNGGFLAARSAMHELVGLSILLAGGVILGMFDAQLGPFFILCVVFHFFLDFINGKTFPYRKIRRDFKMIDFGKTTRLRVIQEVGLNVVYFLIFAYVYLR